MANLPSQPAHDGGSASRSTARVAGVTGTNGKTTTTTMLEAIAVAAGETTARVTTVGAWVRGEPIGGDTQLDVMRRTLEAAAQAQVRTLFLEMTSYALSQGVLKAVPAPSVAVFTNLSRDHLDYHGTPEHYLASKAQLFMSLPPGGAAVLNAADPASALLDEVTPPEARRRAYSAGPVDAACAALPLALQAGRVRVDRAGTHVELLPSPLAERLGDTLELRILGEVHAENALAAAVAADVLGYPAEAIRAALGSFAGVPGRFQVVEARKSRQRGASPTVVVDYAHTPDALERTLRLARSLAGVGVAAGRVFCVFGCGGDRDPGKRAEMGVVAGRLADVVVVTTDNPRSEDPEAIAGAILNGMEGRYSRPLRINDRARAIRRAIEDARGSDIVVIAGKGHEKTQVLRDRVVPFDDVEVARSALEAAAGERTGRKSRT